MQPDNHPELFPWVLVVMSAISLQCFIIPFAHTVRVRGKVFTKEFMAQFQEEHNKAFPGTALPDYGFPDMGNGYYSKKLSYADWYRFNNAQRIHYNFLESLPFILVLIFIAGLKQPLAALILSCLYFTFRLIYAIGYVTGGPNLRLIGSLPNLIIQFALFGLSIYTCSEYMKQYNIDATTLIGTKSSL